MAISSRKDRAESANKQKKKNVNQSDVMLSVTIY